MSDRRFKIFSMIYVYLMILLLNDALHMWPGVSFYMTFKGFMPALAAMVTVFTFLAAIISAILKLFEIIVNPFLRNSKILPDIKILYGWFFLIAFPVLLVKIFKQWTDSFTSITHWNLIRLIIFSVILSGASVLAYRMKEKLIENIREKLTPIFWIFTAVSICSVSVVAIYVVQGNLQDSTATVRTSEAAASKPNIIFVTLDALTARDMSVYGYQRKTTPFLEELVKESYIFRRVHSNSNYTTPSVTSILTSKYPWSHQIYHLLGSISDDASPENIIGVLRENGYTTMSFVANPVADPYRLNIASNFDMAVPSYELVTPQKIYTRIELMARRIMKNRFNVGLPWLLSYLKKVFAWEDTSVTEVPVHLAFDQFFKNVSTVNKPFFAWIHLYPPHSPYLPPENYQNTFTNADKKLSEKKQLEEDGPYPPALQTYIDALRNKYDEFVLYCDSELRLFVKQLRERGLYDNSVLIISSDHGENFERGYYGHRGPFLYEPLVHIPMILHEPGQSAGIQIDSLVEQIDIAPTLLDYAGFQIPQWMEGKSFFPLLRNGTLLSGPKFSMWFEKNRARNHPLEIGTVAVFDGDFKLIYYLVKDHTELFNLSLDPEEKNNLAEVEPAVAQRLKSMILEKIREINAGRKG